MGRTPDVLVVLADQWRGQDQGWIGNDEVHTPHLDKLTETGVAIECTIANHPVCTPSRGDLLTGVHPHRHRAVANDIPIDPTVPTWATVLRDAGHRTSWIGKWHLDGPVRDAPVPAGTAGFDRFASTSCSHDYLDGHYFLSQPGQPPQRVDFAGYEPEVQTELALAALAEPVDEPKCVVVSYGPPHNPYPDVPRRYLDRYDPAGLTLRPNVAAAGQSAQRARLAQYYAGISAVDTQLGRLVADLAERGRLDDTLLIVTADHGDMLGSHGRVAKQVPYAESVRVPLVVHWPAELPSRRFARADGVVGIVDLAATVLDLLGQPSLPHSDGRSVATALRTGTGLPQRALIGNLISVDEGWRQGVGEWRGFVDTTTTYARDINGQPWLLFDDLADPAQLTNLAGTEATASLIATAGALLDQLLAEADDPGGDAATVLRRADRVEEWNARERQQHGERARLLPTGGMDK